MSDSRIKHFAGDEVTRDLLLRHNNARIFKKNARIVAVQQPRPFDVETEHGTMDGEIGDWLATNHPDDDPGSDVWPISNERMRATYVAFVPEDVEGLGNPRFLELNAEERRIHVAKAAGYSGKGAQDTWANFREAEGWGVSPLRGCLVRMGDKYRRAQNLMRDPSNDQVGEPLKDTLMDLSNYAKIAICLWEEEELSRVGSKINTAFSFLQQHNPDEPEDDEGDSSND